MPHQCVRCNTFYEDGAEEILKGCHCGARLFFYIRKEHLEKSKDLMVNLTKNEKKQIEQDVFDIIGVESDDASPVVLDMESIRILKPGQYEIDLVHLFKNDPVVYKVGEGKYLIDLLRTFRGREE
jgi:predicted  nucleic acid-binding Zn-ribbon protein